MSYCELCGSPTDKHPTLCEFHRPQMENRDVMKFEKGIITLGKWNPVYIKDAELVTHRYERQATEIYMTGYLAKNRKIYKCPGPGYFKLFNKAEFKSLDSDKKIKMRGIHMLVDEDSMVFSGLGFSHAYHVRIDISVWRMIDISV